MKGNFYFWKAKLVALVGLFAYEPEEVLFNPGHHFCSFRKRWQIFKPYRGIVLLDVYYVYFRN